MLGLLFYIEIKQTYVRSIELMLASNKLMLDQTNYVQINLYLDQKNLHSDHLYILEKVL